MKRQKQHSRTSAESNVAIGQDAELKANIERFTQEIARHLRNDLPMRDRFARLSEIYGGDEELSSDLLFVMGEHQRQTKPRRDANWAQTSKKGRRIIGTIRKIAEKISEDLDPEFFLIRYFNQNVRFDAARQLKTAHDAFLESGKNYCSELKRFLSSGRQREKSYAHRPMLAGLVNHLIDRKSTTKPEVLFRALSAILNATHQWCHGKSEPIPLAYKPKNLKKLSHRSKLRNP